jgi:hypothetical protein
MPGSRLEIFEGSGHFPHHDDPERFVRIVERFLEATAPATHDQTKWRRLLRDGRVDRTTTSTTLDPHLSSGA